MSTEATGAEEWPDITIRLPFLAFHAMMMQLYVSPYVQVAEIIASLEAQAAPQLRAFQAARALVKPASGSDAESASAGHSTSTH